MAASIKVGVDVSDNGTVSQLQTKLKGLNKELASLKNAMRQTGSGSAGYNGPGKQENIEYRNARGVAGTGGGGSRDFAKQAQGLGGLVHLYATFAANIFAVSAAFMALDKAAQFEQMIEGAKALEATTGAALRSIAGQMKDVTDGALSMQESMRLTALGSAAGLSQKKILELTKGAKGASLALGRDMGDSIDRVIRGVAKLEPELLDELGVVTRAQEAYKKYAQSIGVTSDALTSYQKTIAYSNAVSTELLTKFGAIADKVPANPYAKFLGQLKDVGTELLTLVNTVITPVVAMLSNNIELMFAGVLLLVKSLTMRAIPEISKMFTVSPAVVTARHAALTSLLADIDAGNKAEVESTRRASLQIIQIKEQEALALSKIGAKNINALAATAFKTSRGQTAKNLLEVGSVGAIVDDTKLRAAVPSAMKRESKVLSDYAGGIGSEKEAIAANARYVALEKIEKQIVAEEKRRLVLAEQINLVLKGQEAAEIEIANTLRTKEKYSLAERDAAILNLEVKKLEGAQIVQNTLYLKGQAAAEIERAKQNIIIEEARKAKTLTSAGNVRPGYNKDASGKENKNFGLSGEMVPNFFGKIEEGTDRIKTKIGDMVSKVGTGLGRVVGFLGTWGIAAMVAYEAISFLADKAGWLNKKTDELNKSLEDGSKILETATSSYKAYTVAQQEAVYSLVSLQKANDIASNTLEQGTASIQTQIQAFTEWKEAGGWITSFWDKLGTSKFDTLKENITAQITAMSKVAKGAQAEELAALAEISKGAEESKGGLVALNDVQIQLEGTAIRVANANRNQNSVLKDYQDKANAAATAIEKLAEKDWIKDDKRRTIVEFLKELQKNLQDVNVDFNTKINLLAGVPDGLTTAAGKKLEEIKKTAAEIQAIQQAVGEEQKKQEAKRSANLLEFKGLSDKTLSNLNSGESFNQDQKLIRDRFALERKLSEENISADEKSKIQSSLKLIDLERKYLTSNQRADANKKLVDLAAYYKYVETYQEYLNTQKKLADLTGVDYWYEKMKLALTNLDLWFQAKGFFSVEAPKAPKVEPTDPKLAGLQKLLALANAETERLKKELADIIKINEKAMKEETALGNKSKDNNSGDALRKEQYTAQLALLKAQEAEQVAINSVEKQRLGYNRELSVEAEFAIKSKILEISYDAELLDVKLKATKAAKDTHMTIAQTNDLVAISLQAFELEYSTKEKILKIDKAKRLEQEANLRYLEEIKNFQELSLVLATDLLALDKEAGTVSSIELINRESGVKLMGLEIKRQEILNKLKGQGVVNPELQPGVGNAADITALKQTEAAIDKERADAKIKNANQIRNMEEEKFSNTILKNQSIMDIEAEAGKVSLDILDSRIKAEDDLFNSKMKTAKDAGDINKQEALQIENINRKYKEQQEILEAKKKNFSELSTEDSIMVMVGEADKRARAAAAGLKSAVDSFFDGVYGGMDTAIDTLVEKLFTGQKLGFKDIIRTWSDEISAESRKWLADWLKVKAKQAIASTFKIEFAKTNEELALSYAEQSTNYLKNIDETLSGGVKAQAANTAGSTAGSFLKDAPGMEGQTAFSELSLAEKWSSNSGFNMNSAADNAENAASSAEYFKTANIDAIDEVGTTFQDMLSSAGNGLDSVFGNSGIFGKLLSGMGSGLDSIISGISGMFSGGGAGGSGGGIGGLIGQGMDWLSSFSFANGGIMSEYGPLKLNKYASGGIANSPQMAIFGEGSKPEAYVPLPDGKNIPVVMNNNNSNTTTAAAPAPVYVTNNFTIQGNPTRESQQQIASRVGQSINRAVQRNG
jgi:hypothetical protein